MKNRLETHTIICRAAWCLQRSAVSQTHQVYTYLCDLSNLPQREQKHWQP